MDIQQIKSSLDITEVAQGLGIQIDKNGKALCPFHDDSNPSLQFSKQKQICTCFSSRCNAGSMDVIDLTEKYLNVSKHEALKYLTQLAGGEVKKAQEQSKSIERDYAKAFEKMKSSFISSSTARKYAESRQLNRALLHIGYNPFKSAKFDYLKGCIVFGLRDQSGRVVSLYGRSIRNNDTSKHYYTPQRSGLYPSYPRAKTKRLILTESVVDAATLLSMLAITSQYEILACYGTNGLKQEHIEAIKGLKQLEEIIFFFDGDEAGTAAVEKYKIQLHKLISSLKISAVNTPEDEDINSIAQNQQTDFMLSLIDQRELFSFSEEKTAEKVAEVNQLPTSPKIDTSNPNNIIYITAIANYYIKGGLRKELDSMKVTLVIEHPTTFKRSRNKLDLYEDRLTNKVCREAAEKLSLRADLLERDVNHFTDLLDVHRDQDLALPQEPASKGEVLISSTSKKSCIDFLSKSELLPRINKLIGEYGVVGEENNRIFLFAIASSYKMFDTLHALVQGSSGSGKTHLLATMLAFMPQKDVISLTRVTESSFYNYGEYELQHKLIGLEDYDGLEEKAEFAFRELQSKGAISSSTTVRDEQTGKNNSVLKFVYGPIASLAATTKGEIYEDNMSRCFLVAVDESEMQTMRIIKYQNKDAAGYHSKTRKEEIKVFLQNCIRVLQPYEVINPYADKIDLPKEAHKIRRLNNLFQCFVRQITLLNQYQRQKDAKGRLITQKEDIKTAIDIMFESIILKVDELDGSLRSFYERLKEYVKAKGDSYEFGQREIRQAFKMSKSQAHRYIQQLTALEYISKTLVSARNTYHYKIAFWDNMEALRARIRKDLNDQLSKL